MRAAVARAGMVALFAAVPLLVGAGMPYRVAELFPENRAAQKVGALTAHLTDHGGGKGVISVTLPTGEVLAGQYSINVGGSVGAFGRAHGIDRPGGAYGETYSMEGASPVVADMKGSRGTTAHCELMNDDPHWNGSGVCQLSNGADYRVRY